MIPDFQRIIDYYTETGLDYQSWSKQFNMHFGYYRWGMNPLDLEGMLDQMNREVIQRLALDSFSSQVILDMGCGLGTTARYTANAMPKVSIFGITIVSWQIQRAVELTESTAAGRRVFFVNADYSATPFCSNTFDGIYALESSCYAPGYGKEPLLKEACRILKPGKRLVIADAFLKSNRPMDPLTHACYKAICSRWSLGTLGNINRFTECLRLLGFRDIRVENISRNVAPSVLHIPMVTLRFLMKELFAHRPAASPRQWGNVMACILLLIFALDRTRSGYFIVSATKGQTGTRQPSTATLNPG